MVMLLLCVSPLWAAGSWVGNSDGLRVWSAERMVSSAGLQPPAAITGGHIESVRWQFRSVSGEPLNSWLCHADNCARLPSTRGITEHFAGLPADTIFYFRFALRPEQRQMQQVNGLQVIVNYQ